MNELCVKGRMIGSGKPIVCVPVMAESREAIVAEVKRLVARPADMIEWRVDAFSGAGSLNAIREVLTELAPLVQETILVYTFRSKRQGGLADFTPEQVRDIREAAAELKTADFIDVEFFEAMRPKREIAKLRDMGARVIASHHDFSETPERSVIRMLLDQMYESEADVLKLALMPKCVQDVFHLMEETYAFHEENPMRPLITMSMGREGTVSRVAGEFFGSCVTFGSGEAASAPGQLPADALGQILSILHENMKTREN